MEKTTGQILEQRKRMYHIASELGRRNAKNAHPETNGEDLLVHNWGNDESKKAISEMWSRINKFYKISDVMYKKAFEARWGKRI